MTIQIGNIYFNMSCGNSICIKSAQSHCNVSISQHNELLSLGFDVSNSFTDGYYYRTYKCNIQQ